MFFGTTQYIYIYIHIYIAKQVYIYGSGRLTAPSGGIIPAAAHVSVKVAWVGIVGWVGGPALGGLGPWRPKVSGLEPDMLSPRLKTNI